MHNMNYLMFSTSNNIVGIINLVDFADFFGINFLCIVNELYSHIVFKKMYSNCYEVSIFLLDRAFDETAIIGFVVYFLNHMVIAQISRP